MENGSPSFNVPFYIISQASSLLCLWPCGCCVSWSLMSFGLSFAAGGVLLVWSVIGLTKNFPQFIFLLFNFGFGCFGLVQFFLFSCSLIYQSVWLDFLANLRRPFYFIILKIFLSKIFFHGFFSFPFFFLNVEFFSHLELVFMEVMW